MRPCAEAKRWHQILKESTMARSHHGRVLKGEEKGCDITCEAMGTLGIHSHKQEMEERSLNHLTTQE